jgi:hypothetical protein
VGPDRVLGRERPGHARRGRQRGARGAEPRAHHGGALALLEDLYKRQRNWDSYVEILIAQAPAGDDDPYKLREAYREVLRYEPQHWAR